MGDPYGFGAEPVDFQPIATDYEIGRYALRTFSVTGGELSSIAQGIGHWHDGVCEARCLVCDHDAPAERCKCGIYGMLTEEALVAQYPQHASRVVAVFAAEGTTYIGDRGLRTQAARIVAYWCAGSDLGNDSHQQRAEMEVYKKEFPGARQFFDRRVMIRVYGLS